MGERRQTLAFGSPGSESGPHGGSELSRIRSHPRRRPVCPSSRPPILSPCPRPASARRGAAFTRPLSMSSRGGRLSAVAAASVSGASVAAFVRRLYLTAPRHRGGEPGGRRGAFWSREPALLAQGTQLPGHCLGCRAKLSAGAESRPDPRPGGTEKAPRTHCQPRARWGTGGRGWGWPPEPPPLVLAARAAAGIGETPSPPGTQPEAPQTPISIGC